MKRGLRPTHPTWDEVHPSNLSIHVQKALENANLFPDVDELTDVQHSPNFFCVFLAFPRPVSNY